MTVSIDYREPTELRDVLTLLSLESDGTRLLAGGQSLIPAMHMRQLHPRLLVGLSRVRELAGIEVEPSGAVRIGATTTQRTLETSAVVRERCPVLATASSLIASVHVRNLGTIGGNLCQNAPGADFPPPLIALDAVLTLASIRGARHVAVADFCGGAGTAALASDEMLAVIVIPPPPPRSRAVYLKHRAGAVDRALVGVAVRVSMAEDGVTCAGVRVGIGGASDRPYRSRRMEATLAGERLDDRRIEEAAQAAAGECEPRSDAHGSAAYRRKMVAVFVRRALQAARGGAR